MKRLTETEGVTLGKDNNMKYLAAAIAVIAATPAIMPAAQAQTAYTDKAAFLTAAGSTQTETFSTATTGRFASTGADGNFSNAFDGFTITGKDFGNYVGIATGAISSGGPDYNIPSSFTGQNYLTWGNITGNTVSLTINFNAATTAFGFDWFNTDFSDQYAINLPGGTVFSGPPFTLARNGTTSGFFGLVSATPFSSVVITNNRFGGYISDEGMDNFITNGAGSVNGAVPEPASWAMMILGMGAVGGALRRRSKVATKVAFA
jgi:hypothetical protein